MQREHLIKISKPQFFFKLESEHHGEIAVSSSTRYNGNFISFQITQKRIQHQNITLIIFILYLNEL